MPTEKGESGGLRAGAARIDITPPLGVQIDGDIGRWRPTEEIRERLWANALVLEAGGRHIGIVSLDLCGIGEPWVGRIRGKVSRAAGIAPGNLMLHSVQNHAAPSIGDSAFTPECRLVPDDLPWLRGGCHAYAESASEACVRAVTEAAGRLEPVTVSMGRRTDGRVSFIRRFIMRDGTARTHPPNCDPGILHAEGVIDPEVSVAMFAGASGRPVAALLHFTCHPTHGYPERYIIGDWPGKWGELFMKKAGEGCVPLVFNGACGNVHHENHLSPGSRDDHKAMAGKLMETTERIMGEMKSFQGVPVRTASRIVRLGIRKLGAKELAEARAIIKANPLPDWEDEARTQVKWDWVYAASRLDLHALSRRVSRVPYKVQVFRIGDLGIAAMGGEPFVEMQLELKAASKSPFTMVAHHSNGMHGYIPTRQALKAGGYETRTALWSMFEPAALEKITGSAKSLLAGLF